MKLKEITIKDAKSISNVIEKAIIAADCYVDWDDSFESLKSSMKTLSNLLKETK